MIQKIIKRDNITSVEYNPNKIRSAISRASLDVPIEDRISDEDIQLIIHSIEKDFADKNTVNVEEIQNAVEDQLMKMQKFVLAKTYITYRHKRALIRKANSTDESILQLINDTNNEVQNENSNKKASINSTKRDLIAGEVSKDLTNRLLLPKNVIDAHNRGDIHFHDMDYFMMKEFNCCLPNFKDMLKNGTMMNGVKIDTPKSFRVACNQVTQIMANVSSNQYGGQTFYSDTLGEYLAYTEEKIRKRFSAVVEESTKLNDKGKTEIIEKLVENELHEELKAGIQCIQYQINTLMTTNGQTPFVTIFMYLRKDDPYKKQNAMIMEEIFNQRIQGIQNKNGVYITPTFPKLVYVLTEENNLTGGKYDYLTKLAAKCTAYRMYPDYISEKIMKENYGGEVFGPMGCRSFLSAWRDPETGKYKWEGRFNQGVVTLNLPMIALDAAGNEADFWSLLEERLTLCYQALMCRHNALKGTKSDVSPIHWQDGAIARLKPGETIDHLLYGGYSTISLGYIGLYECVKYLTGESHTDGRGRELSLRIMNRLRDAADSWKKATGIGFGLYGTPAESTCYTLCKKIRKVHGVVKDITDKDWITNSYHIDVRENIDAFTKFIKESIYQKISSGGNISYVEIPDMTKNLPALESLIKFVYDHLQYAEFNTRADNCNKCGYTGEIRLNENKKWECPNCHNRDKNTLNVTRRTCGYLGTLSAGWNDGKTREIDERVIHLNQD